jgi:hypothetical protein
MYCPSCGSEERQLSQFCRTCGTDLRPARPTSDRVDALTASAVSAREQISLAVADKIRQMESSKDLKRIAEDVLPAFEKFLQSPEEKRLRRVRIGMVTTAIGLAGSVASFLLAMAESDFFPLLIPCFIMFMVGLSVVINGLVFTVPRKRSSIDSGDVLPPARLSGMTRTEPPAPNVRTNDLALPSPMPSVTDHTTHHLKQKP